MALWSKRFWIQFVCLIRMTRLREASRDVERSGLFDNFFRLSSFDRKLHTCAYPRSAWWSDFWFRISPDPSLALTQWHWMPHWITQFGIQWIQVSWADPDSGFLKSADLSRLTESKLHSVSTPLKVSSWNRILVRWCTMLLFQMRERQMMELEMRKLQTWCYWIVWNHVFARLTLLFLDLSKPSAVSN